MSTAAPIVAWSGRFLQTVVDDGWEYCRRVHGFSAAAILAITDDGEAVLVEQYRAPLGRRTIELPAGLVGDAVAGEDPADAARRELAEETGYAAAALRHLGEFAASPGMSAETFHLFLATGLTGTGPGGGTTDEAITVHLVPLSGLWAFLDMRRAAGCAVDCRLLAFLPWASVA